MGQIITAITSIVQAIGSFLAVAFQFILGITQLLSMLPDAITMTNYAIASMPLILVSFATAFIGVSVVYLIIGR